VQDGTLHPRALKARIAGELVTTFHNAEAAASAEEHFNRLFREHQAPDDMEEVSLAIDDGKDTLWIALALVGAGLSESNRKARKAIAAGSVKMDGDKITDEDTHLEPGEFVLQVGKRNFRKVSLAKGR